MFGKNCCHVITILTISSLSVVVCSSAPGQIVYPPSRTTPSAGHAPPTSAISAVLEANGGKVPTTGAQLWHALDKLDHFCQLPVAFSAVRLDSGLAHPRVVITPRVDGLGRADVTESNLAGRLFLAANMEREVNGDPRVTSVEFISWNTMRRKFDFGVIENMGGSEMPQLRIVDGGRCFACHKNRGPILGARPWSNTTHDDILRLAEAHGFGLIGSNLPATGPFIPQPLRGKPLRERLDGMSLAKPEASAVDAAVRFGANLRLYRDTFRLMTRSSDGRKALVLLLTAMVRPGELDANDRVLRQQIDSTFDRSFLQFAQDWVSLEKEAKSSILADADPAVLLIASGVRPRYQPVRPTPRPLPRPAPRPVVVPGLTGGGGSRWAAPPSQLLVTSPSQNASAQTPTPISPGVALAMIAAGRAADARQANGALAATLNELARYENARSLGFHGLISAAQPSNPRAFIKLPVKAPLRPSSVVNAVMLAETIGLTEKDRSFLATSLALAVKRTGVLKLTAAKLAREVFEGPEFAVALAGGPLPDRDEFKDRFIGGIDGILKTQYASTDGFSVKRSEYASGPKYDPKAVEETEVAVVPTTACLRCHDVRPSGKSRLFEPIPALAFDPFDKSGRETWLRATDKKRKEAVLNRLQKRLFDDSDMPPEDAPERDRFRTQEAAAFAEVKDFIQAEIEKIKR